jgi:hypothetical protein
VPNILYRFGESLLRYIEFVGPVLNFMGLKKADSASILRTPVGEIIWHALSPLDATRWRATYRSAVLVPLTTLLTTLVLLARLLFIRIHNCLLG